MKYYLIAGEASGDLHGSNLMKALAANDPKSDFRFWGGDLMSSVSGELVHHYKDGAVMGFTDVLLKLGTLSRNLSRCKADILSYQPDVVILIDYPGFNLRIAEFAKKAGFKVYYYIAPKLWARGEGRIKKIRKYVDELFIIFPFEVDYFKKLGVNAHYYGNPLIDSISQDKCMKESRDEFFERTKLVNKHFVALLPGSRVSEVKYLLPRMVQVASIMKKNAKWDDYQMVVAAAPSINEDLYKSLIPDNLNIIVEFGETYSILNQADAAIISSGTASLEASIIATPQVVCYGIGTITYYILKSIIKIKYYSLANLILNKSIFKELIQYNATAENIYKELERLVFDNEYRSAMEKDYAEVREVLGGEGASNKIALSMINLLNQ